MEKSKIIEGKLFVDDRGSVSCVNGFDFKDIKRFYMVENHQQGFTRAWHGHRQEKKYVYVVSGSALIAIVPLEDLELCPRNDRVKKEVLSSKIPKIFYIPSGYANGFMTLESDTKIMFFSTSTIEESKNDDIRFPFDQINCWKVMSR